MSGNARPVTTCLSCGSNLGEVFCDLGAMPVANAYLPTDADLAAEARHPLRAPLKLPHTVTETTGPVFPPRLFPPLADLSMVNGRPAQGERIIATAEGNGPVNALDAALRSAVTQQYPELADIDLVDYKVRILADAQGTGATTRVLVGSRNGENEWTTVGVHENVIAASWIALEDALTFGLLHTESAGR